jgi:FAD/FMN-containing dehydrogenase
MRFTRRTTLKRIAATAICTPVLLLSRRAKAELPPLPNLPAIDALLLRPGDAQFDEYSLVFNARTMLAPQLRATCKNDHAVGDMVDWCRNNNLPFALRSGGHCYEGFSESASVVIDTRLMNEVNVDPGTMTAIAGAGASLGDVYKAIAPHGLAFPGGSCPTVGISGHVLGGGYGYLARPFGLACDSVISINLVDPQGRHIQADARHSPDLFWACRGGGGGSFGAATSFQLKLHSIKDVFVFDIGWESLTLNHASTIMKDWQAWAPQAPATITANLVIDRHLGGGINLRCSGQTIGTLTELQRELAGLSSRPSIEKKSYMEAINHFSGDRAYKSILMKGKSDYASLPLNDAGLSILMNEINRRNVTYVICDPYGGAIADITPDSTAFAHRRHSLFCLQYVSEWANSNEAPQRLSEMRDFYDTMRPYVSGAAYVNYCDLDLSNWPTAYWGMNLARLKQIKSVFDPDNVFRHAQSVPLT